jgi:hypothetical protein
MGQYRSSSLTLLLGRASRAAVTTVPEDDAGMGSGVQTASPLLFRVRPVSSPLKIEPCLASGQQTETVC